LLQHHRVLYQQATMTQLLVIRHGDAGDAEEFAATGRSDDERPLTDKGIREMERVAAGLRSLTDPIDLLATSPLVRARQTAEIVGDAYGIDIAETIEALRPTSALDAFVGWFRGVSDRSLVAIVGHDPHLSRLVTWLMSGVDAERVALKKGGACLLEFEDAPGPGSGTLQWLITPKIVGAKRGD
jgi:phosphohistidine phosphatase